ncbi:MAG: NADH-quinone oxidoreductase subunit J [Deltaproteobacteria bacterium]|nr:NADH-quinone oxidoreductase subunit J [Deltaproteobacteria bacterium]
MVTEIVFWILAVVCVSAALAVVFVRDIFRAALLLVLCFFTVAGIFITLNADFLAAVQVLVYIGAVAILLIFAIMLTREVKRGNPFNRFKIPAFLAAALVLVMVVLVVVNTDWPSLAIANHAVGIAVDEPTTAAIGTALFDKDVGFILPFEVASILLLAAILGAIALVREQK